MEDGHSSRKVLEYWGYITTPGEEAQSRNEIFLMDKSIKTQSNQICL